jgi:alpha-amylase
MRSVTLCFQVHQPFRIKPYTFFDIGKNHSYEDEGHNKLVIDRVSDLCYLPTNKILLQLIKKYKGQFRVAFSISGTSIEQFKLYRPDVIESFIALAKTDCVEFLAETYYHSLSSVFSPKTFIEQIDAHRKLIRSTFDYQTEIFRNTELIHNNAIAEIIKNLGLKGLITEGIPNLLESQSTNKIYSPAQTSFPIILRNCILSDDIAFRFSDKNWKGYPLTVEKYSSWIHNSLKKNENATIYVDYETFGEHQKKNSGIFTFLRKLPGMLIDSYGLEFMNPSEVIDYHDIHSVYDAHETISWADMEKNLSAWYLNSMQKEAIEKIYGLEPLIRKMQIRKHTEKWNKLQTSDHFYYMSTKGMSDGEVHQYFSPFNSPHDAYLHYMNVVADFELEVRKKKLFQ